MEIHIIHCVFYLIVLLSHSVQGTEYTSVDYSVLKPVCWDSSLRIFDVL
jgi:hypothetical protein